MISPYFQVFLESIGNAFFIPIIHDTTFFALKSFGGYPIPLIYALAVFGATLGQCFNWGIGRLMRAFPVSELPTVKGSVYKKLERFFQKSPGLYLVVLCWLPLGSLIPIAAGLFGANLSRVFCLLLVAELVNYGRFLLH